MVHLRGSLTRSLKAGDSVTLSGIFLPEPYTGARAMLRASLLTATYMEVGAGPRRCLLRGGPDCGQLLTSVYGRASVTILTSWAGYAVPAWGKSKLCPLGGPSAYLPPPAGHVGEAEQAELPGDGAERGAARRHRADDRGGRHLLTPGRLHRAGWVPVASG